MARNRKSANNQGLEITAAFIESLTADFALHGPDTLQRLRSENPGAYCRLASELTIKQPEQPESPFDSMFTEELRAYCGDDDDGVVAKMAQDLPRYEYLLKQARKQAKRAKVVEPVDPNEHNRLAKAAAAERVPWRRPQ
jgi:hypothetical protein